MIRLLAALCVLLVAWAAPARADERILNFVSDATVSPDGAVTVRETITVLSEGEEIRRGILRDFPTTYRDRSGTRVRVGFEVLDVKRDGRAETWSTEPLVNGTRIRIGSPDVMLSPGNHTYVITYRTTRQLGFFDRYDELYWNVTGNGWTFPIDRAEAIIRLPSGARILQSAAYTGPQGASGSDFEIVGGLMSEFRARTTRTLQRGEGFTVAVGWQKGIVAPPTSSENWRQWIGDNAGILALLVSLMVSGAYYAYAWNLVGRDPPKGTIIPLFAPPPGIGPAGARYVFRHKLDERGFSAAMVSLAVKGFLKITDDDGDFSVTRIDSPAKPGNLTKAEQALLQALPSGTTALKQTNHEKIKSARQAIENALSAEFEGSVFVRNLKWFWLGAAISIVGLLLANLMMPAGTGMFGTFIIVWSAVWWSVILVFAWAAVKGIIRGRGIVAKLSSVFMLLFLIPFFFGGIAVPLFVFFGDGPTETAFVLGAAALMGVMNLVFYHLLRAPTEPGRRLLDRIEGFKMYLSAAEEERLKVLHPPEKTPELFERYLPFALALDCENEWNAKFSAVLAAAAAAGAAAPAWYAGSHWNGGRTGAFTDSLGSSLSSSVASASTAPGSSSGSGGGGFSGGGGGGGGGSGW